MIKKMKHLVFGWLLMTCSAFFAVAQTTTPGDAIKFMAYNVHHCNPPSKPGVIDIDAVVRVIKKENPDIVALQEIDVNTNRSGKMNEAEVLSKKTGYHSFHFSKSIDHDGGDYGIMLLSKYPLSAMETHKLPTDSATGGEPRVLCVATATLPGGKQLRVASLHLDFKGPTNGKLQMTAVNKILSTESLPVIIGGDFNAEENSETIALLDQEFTRTCKQCPFTIPETNPDKAIDFIAYKPATAFKLLRHQVIAETYASDHRPVVAVLSVHL